MSLYAALYAGVSGLGANSTALGIISDNITNVNTVGYKGSETEFSTLVTETKSSSSYQAGGVSAKVRTLVGKQGLLQSSSSNTDLSIDGQGFFVVRTSNDGNGEVRFTRAGSFRPDSEGYLQNTAGQYLQGWPINSDGTYSNDGDVNKLVPINTAGLTGTAEATTKISLRANLQSSLEPNPLASNYNASDPANNMASGAIEPDFKRSVDVFDAQGGTHSITTAYLKDPNNPNRWFTEVYVEPASDVTTVAPNVDGQLATGVVAFNSDGSLDGANTTPGLDNLSNIEWTNGAESSNIELDLGTDGEVDGLTQFDSTSTLISKSVDGAVFGNVTGVDIGKDGVVTALFDNGLTRDVYKLPIATFQNPDGLTRLQGNSYGVSDLSGEYSLVEAGTGGGGSVAPSTLEQSTVDLAAEFSKMIIVQRAYSASSRIITTADEMLQELNNLKR